MHVFTTRPNGYKLGLALLSLGTVFYIVGFASPYWTTYSLSFHYHYEDQNGDWTMRTDTGSSSGSGWGSGWGTTTANSIFDNDADDHSDFGHGHNDRTRAVVYIRGYGGLWRNCASFNQLSNVCVPMSHNSGAPGWVMALQGLQCVGLLAAVVALVYAVLVNWIKKNPSFLRIIETAAALASCTGIIGCILFAVKIKSELVLTEKSLMDLQVLHNIKVDFNHLAWSFGVDVTGCCINFLGAILIACFNRPDKREAGNDNVTAVAQNTEGGTIAGGPSGLTTFDSVTSQPVMGAIAMATVPGFPTAAPNPVYFIHPQQLAGGFSPPPYDPRQVDEKGGGHGADAGVGDACAGTEDNAYDNLPLSDEDVKE